MRGRLSALGLFILVAGTFGMAAGGNTADFPPCPPPSASEYLLLVRGETEADRDRVQDLLPASSTVMVCDYLDDVVVRAGGFTSLETANAWAQYMTEVEELQAFVARPPTASEVVATTQPAPETAAEAAAVAYDPQPLAPGYAVLVDYFNRPEVALDVQQSLSQSVGLVVYRQRPYLLVSQTEDAVAAGSTLQTLSNQNFTAVVVDSRQVVVLTPRVAFADGTASQ
ncbi:MAG: hypothetical protein AAF215_18100 [Cyanobacteria bacterium P01_A01_bin.123]